MIRVCVDDKNLPQGAHLEKGKKYPIIEEFLNHYEQKVYIVFGVPNEGLTPDGMKWIGYNANRFVRPEEYTKVIEKVEEQPEEKVEVEELETV